MSLFFTATAYAYYVISCALDVAADLKYIEICKGFKIAIFGIIIETVSSFCG
jgi:hypothetical protein